MELACGAGEMRSRSCSHLKPRELASRADGSHRAGAGPGCTHPSPPHQHPPLPTETLQHTAREGGTWPGCPKSHSQLHITGARLNAGKKSCTQPTNGISVDSLHCSGWLSKSQTCSNIKLFTWQKDTFTENIFLIRLQESIFPLLSAQNEYEYP